jgi:hypothetical protein
MLRQMPIEPVPHEIARVARAAFPQGNQYLLADELDTLFMDEAFWRCAPRTDNPRGHLSGLRAATITGNHAAGPALMPSISRSIGTSNTRSVRPVRPVLAGQQP